MKNIIAFYDDIFQFHYNRLKDNDSTPEVTPLAIISYIQTFHLLFIYFLFYYLFDLSYFLSLYIVAIIICLIVFGINYYIYIIKNRRDKIIKRNKSLSKHVMLRQNIVGYGSMLLIAVLIILFNEVF